MIQIETPTKHKTHAFTYARIYQNLICSKPIHLLLAVFGGIFVLSFVECSDVGWNGKSNEKRAHKYTKSDKNHLLVRNDAHYDENPDAEIKKMKKRNEYSYKWIQTNNRNKSKWNNNIGIEIVWYKNWMKPDFIHHEAMNHYYYYLLFAFSGFSFNFVSHSFPVFFSVAIHHPTSPEPVHLTIEVCRLCAVTNMSHLMSIYVWICIPCAMWHGPWILCILCLVSNSISPFLVFI